MVQNIQDYEQLKRIAELCKIALERYEPYPFGEPKLQMYDSDLDDDRLTATMAKRFLIEHGIQINE